MKRQLYASLFGPGQASFEEAQEWIRQLNDGEIKWFVPVHGKIAGYHAEPCNTQVPIQRFDPPLGDGQEVKVLFINKSGNISLMRDDEGVLRFFPHINANIEYAE
jgi:hypothetical protein